MLDNLKNLSLLFCFLVTHVDNIHQILQICSHRVEVIFLLQKYSVNCRGKRSLETICLTLAYKIKYPENVFLLRGNHECASINRLVFLMLCAILQLRVFI